MHGELLKVFSGDDDAKLLTRLRQLRSDAGTGFDLAMVELERRLADLREVGALEAEYAAALANGVVSPSEVEESFERFLNRELAPADMSRYDRGVHDGENGTPPTEASAIYLRGYVKGKKRRV